jgi:hypothetical protein
MHVRCHVQDSSFAFENAKLPGNSIEHDPDIQTRATRTSKPIEGWHKKSSANFFVVLARTEHEPRTKRGATKHFIRYRHATTANADTRRLLEHSYEFKRQATTQTCLAASLSFPYRDSFYTGVRLQVTLVNKKE